MSKNSEHADLQAALENEVAEFTKGGRAQPSSRMQSPSSSTSHTSAHSASTQTRTGANAQLHNAHMNTRDIEWIRCSFSGIAFPICVANMRTGMQRSLMNAGDFKDAAWLHPLLTAQMHRTVVTRLPLVEQVAVRAFELVRKGYIARWSKPFNFESWTNAQLNICNDALHALASRLPAQTEEKKARKFPQFALTETATVHDFMAWIATCEDIFHNGFITDGESRTAKLLSLDERRANARDAIYKKLQNGAFRKGTTKAALAWLLPYMERFHAEWEIAHSAIVKSALQDNKTFPTETLKQIRYMLNDCNFPLHESASKHYEHMLIVQALDARILAAMQRDVMQESADAILREMSGFVEGEVDAPQNAKFALAEVVDSYTFDRIGTSAVADIPSLASASATLEAQVSNAAKMLDELAATPQPQTGGLKSKLAALANLNKLNRKEDI